MEELLKNLTDTELLKIISDTTSKHEEVKKEILNLLDQYDQKNELLESLEGDYKELVTELERRSNGIRKETLS